VLASIKKTIFKQAERQHSLNGHLPGQPKEDGTRLPPFWIFLYQAWWRSWWQLVHSSSQIVATNIPTPHFLQARCPSCRPTNSIRSLKEELSLCTNLLTPSSPGVFRPYFDQ